MTTSADTPSTEPVDSQRISVVLPVYNEAENIIPCLRQLWEALGDVEHEILVCYDFAEDTTLAAIESMEDCPTSVRLVKNDLGKGVLYAMKAGFLGATGDVVVTTMADLSDPPTKIPEMAAAIRKGADVVSGSRYMKGGSQTGGPPLKGFLSRGAGLSLRWIAGVTTHDSTNNFRAYSRAFLQQVEIESASGFELALELTVKAHLKGRPVDQIASSWQDRSAGESRFQLAKWLPSYLFWYARAMLEPAVVLATWAALTAAGLYFLTRFSSPIPFLDDLAMTPKLSGAEPVTLDWLWSQHNEHRIPLPRLYLWFLVSVVGGGLRLPMFGCFLALSATALVALLVIRRTRGRLVLSDLVIPLLLMHWGHAENFIWSHQIQFVGTSVLLCVFAIAMYSLSKGKPLRADLAAIAGLAAVCLPLFGAQGLVPGLPVAALLVAVGVMGPKLVAMTARARAISLSSGVVALIISGLYFVSYTSPTHHPASGGFAAIARHTIAFLATGILPSLDLWPGSGFFIAPLYVLALGIAVWALRRSSRPRLPVAGLLAVGAGVVALASAIAMGRSGFGVGQAFSMRYALLSAPGILAAYLLFNSALRGPVQAALRTSVVLVVLCAVSLNMSMGFRFGIDVRTALQKVELGVLNGRPMQDIAREYKHILHPDPNYAAARYGELRVANMPPYDLSQPKEQMRIDEVYR